MTAERQLPETMGAGAALADLNGDGQLDIYFVQSGRLPDPRPSAGTPLNAPEWVNQLFLNAGSRPGAFAFRDATAESGAAAHPGYGMGVAVGDVDGDGQLDLFLSQLGPDALLRNDGDARFQDITGSSPLADPRWTGSAAFFDADLDGDLDLYVAGYVDYDLSEPKWCGRQEEGWRSYCHPDAYAGIQDRFYRNDGRGGFEEATDAAGLTTRPGHHGKGLGVLATDFDGDGRTDLYVANDSVENRLWINRGDGSFSDGTLLSATGVNGRGLTEAGMGLAAGDVDGDGDSELFVTNFDDESNTLYRNDGGGLFTDITARSGLDASSRLPVGFGTVLADFDNDGLLDLAVANGHIIDNIALYHDGKTHAQRALLYRNTGASHFDNISPQAGDLCATDFVGRGLYSGDLDGDGALDLVLTQCDGPAVILRNEAAAQLMEPGAPSSSALILRKLPRGTRVKAVTGSGSILIREAGPQPSYFGQSSSSVHLGLGPGLSDPPQGSAGAGSLAALECRLPNGDTWSLVLSPQLDLPLPPALTAGAASGLQWLGDGRLQIQGRGETMMNGGPLPTVQTSNHGTDR